METTTDRSPETAVIGLKYEARTYDGGVGCSTELILAPWVTRAVKVEAGMTRDGVWGVRRADFDIYLRLPDFDAIAGIDRDGMKCGGGELDAAGVARLVALAAGRKAASEAKKAAELEARRANMVSPTARWGTCSECGAKGPVGEDCGRCMGAGSYV